MIQLQNISKHYKSHNDERIIFDQMSLEINEGDKVAIVGANGSGKSTLLKLLLGQINPDFGTVKKNLSNKETVYLPQDYRNSLFPWLDIRSNLALLLDEKNNNFWDLRLSEDTENKIEKLFDLLEVNINLKKFPYQLSGGEQQGLLIIHAVLREPKLFIADEPFSAIDFHKKGIFENFFSSWSYSNKVTTVVVSHDIEEAVYLSDRIIILTREKSSVKDDFKIDFEFPRLEELKYTKSFTEIISRIKNNFE